MGLLLSRVSPLKTGSTAAFLLIVVAAVDPSLWGRPGPSSTTSFATLCPSQWTRVAPPKVGKDVDDGSTLRSTVSCINGGGTVVQGETVRSARVVASGLPVRLSMPTLVSQDNCHTVLTLGTRELFWGPLWGELSLPKSLGLCPPHDSYLGSFGRPGGLIGCSRNLWFMSPQPGRLLPSL